MDHEIWEIIRRLSEKSGVETEKREIEQQHQPQQQIKLTEENTGMRGDLFEKNEFEFERCSNRIAMSIRQQMEEKRNTETKSTVEHQENEQKDFTTNNTENSHTNPNRIGDLNEEEKKLRNRNGTIKQRLKNYRHEIVLRNINPSFKIIEMKNMLRKWDIEFTAINAYMNEKTGQRSLFIGMRSEEDVKKHSAKTEWLFRNEN